MCSSASMPLTEPARGARPDLSTLRAALAAGALVTAIVQAAETGERRFEVRSNPPGATVETITGTAGKTPIEIPQRAVYPNHYPPEKIGLYGIVTLRKPGCETRHVRLSDTDLRQGMTVTLDCGDQDALLEAGPQKTEDVDRSLRQQRLRQLRVVRELRDNGLLSAAEAERAEAERLRQRILRAD